MKTITQKNKEQIKRMEEEIRLLKEAFTKYPNLSIQNKKQIANEIYKMAGIKKEVNKSFDAPVLSKGDYCAIYCKLKDKK